MELRQIRHFVTVAEEAHFGRAADRLSISQPALSSSIQRLEKDFGLRLFERDSKGVRITLAGKLVLDFARELMAGAEKTKSFVQALSAGQVGRIEVAFNSTVLHQGAIEIIRQCRIELPGIQIYLREMVSERQLELLNEGRLDACIASLPLPPEALQHIALPSHSFMACLPLDHPLASKDFISIEELRNEFFVMHSREQSPGIYDQLVGFCASAGFQPKLACESSHVLSSVFLVARGLGVALVPDSLATLSVNGAVFVPLRRSLPTRNGYFVWNTTHEAPGLKQLIDRVRAYAQLHDGEPSPHSRTTPP